MRVTDLGGGGVAHPKSTTLRVTASTWCLVFAWWFGPWLKVFVQVDHSDALNLNSSLDEIGVFVSLLFYFEWKNIVHATDLEGGGDTRS